MLLTRVSGIYHTTLVISFPTLCSLCYIFFSCTSFDKFLPCVSVVWETSAQKRGIEERPWPRASVAVVVLEGAVSLAERGILIAVMAAVAKAASVITAKPPWPVRRTVRVPAAVALVAVPSTSSVAFESVAGAVLPAPTVAVAVVLAVGLGPSSVRAASVIAAAA